MGLLVELLEKLELILATTCTQTLITPITVVLMDEQTETVRSVLAKFH